MHGGVHDIVALFREHASRVEQLLRRFGVAERDVADATQEVFVVVHRKLGEFEGRASVSTWLYQICLRVAAAERRRARHRREVLSDDAAPFTQASQADLHAELERRRLLEHIADALDALSEAQRTALVLHELEGLHMREIARRLRVPVKTAFSRLYAARTQLRAALRRQGYAVPAWFPLWPGATWSMHTHAAVRGSGHASIAKGGFAMGFALCAALLAPAPAPAPAEHVGPQSAVVRAAATSSPSEVATAAAPRAQLAAASAKPAAKRARARPTPALPVEPEPARPEELVLVRMGGTDLTPVIDHPFATRLRDSTPSLPPLAARLAPSSFEFF